MSGYWVLMANVVLITALTGFIAYLVSRAFNDDEWPK